MKRNKIYKYKSDALEALHETATGLYDAAMLNKKTMKDFDERCLTEVKPLSPKQIKALREKEQVSQEVFARYLFVSKTSVSLWERGVNVPSGPTLKLLTLAMRNGLRSIA